ncbi:S8 family peptidase [Paenibacillus sp. FSL R5-0749]|uniref:S8 family peptidase n=1 Tax=Paenibacillus sp. FSL R5-0749 TaxID=2921657 RepID=UPI00315A7B73
MKRIFCIFLAVFFLCLLIIYILFIRTSSPNTPVDLDRLKDHQTTPWGVLHIGSNNMWKNGVYGEKIRVAVMDSGVALNHPDLRDNLKEGINIIDSTQPPLDDYGHGTLVIGVIGAVNNDYGVIGVAPKAEIYPVKVLDQNGYGEVDDLVKGIEWCINNDIQIINMSFSIKEDNQLFKSAIKRAVEKGIIIVASATNSLGGDIGFPAAYDGVISVVSIDEDLNIDKMSGRGKVDFSAPGVNVVSTSNDGGYTIISGTSIATPHISGAIALLLENNKYVNVHSLYQAVVYDLKSISKDLGSKGYDEVYGNGFVQF